MSESMEQLMEREKAEAIATLNRANGALSRLFGIEKEGEELVCTWCLDNSKSCKACDDSYEGE